MQTEKVLEMADTLTLLLLNRDGVVLKYLTADNGDQYLDELSQDFYNEANDAAYSILYELGITDNAPWHEVWSDEDIKEAFSPTSNITEFKTTEGVIDE